MRSLRHTWLVVVFLLSAGCQNSSNDGAGIKADLHIEPSPPRVGQERVTLKLTGSDGKPLEGAQLKFEGNMAHAGMKPVFADPVETEPGVYEADMKFTMAGDWFLLVTGTRANGQKVEKKIDIRGVKPE